VPTRAPSCRRHINHALADSLDEHTVKAVVPMQTPKNHTLTLATFLLAMLNRCKGGVEVRVIALDPPALPLHLFESIG
jgi:hypothetical protein